MSEYNKTILTNAGLDLMARANKGITKFTITRAATSAEKLSNKSMIELQQLTELPSLMQYGVINDVADAAQDSSIVIGTELVFNNKDLANSYNINAIGLFAKEEGSTKEILYALTTAIAPESMPDFNNKVLFKFNMTMFVAIAQADNVSINVNDNGVVTKLELASKLDSLEKKLQAKIDNAGQIKQISVNKGVPVGPDASGIANLDIPKPDLSGYETKGDAKTAHDTLTSAIARRVLSVNDKTADDAGNVVLTDFDHPTQVFNGTNVDLNTLTSTGLYELRNATIKGSLSSLPGFTQLNATYAYLIAINNPPLNNTFQILICRQMQSFVLDYRYINQTYKDYPDFKRIIDSSDYTNVWNKITAVDNKELVHHCDDLATGVAYSKANPNVFVATP